MNSRPGASALPRKNCRNLSRVFLFTVWTARHATLLCRLQKVCVCVWCASRNGVRCLRRWHAATRLLRSRSKQLTGPKGYDGPKRAFTATDTHI